MLNDPFSSSIFNNFQAGSSRPYGVQPESKYTHQLASGYIYIFQSIQLYFSRLFHPSLLYVLFSSVCFHLLTKYPLTNIVHHCALCIVHCVLCIERSVTVSVRQIMCKTSFPFVYNHIYFPFITIIQ